MIFFASIPSDELKLKLFKTAFPFIENSRSWVNISYQQYVRLVF